MNKKPDEKEGKAVTHTDVLAKFGAEALDYPDARPGSDDPARDKRTRDMIEARLRAESAEEAKASEKRK